MAQAEISIDNELPKVTAEEALEWLDEQIDRARQFIERRLTIARAIRKGEMPITAFGDVDTFDAIKRSWAYQVLLRERLHGIVGSAAGVPADDIDEVFLEIMAELHDVPKVSEAKDPDKAAWLF